MSYSHNFYINIKERYYAFTSPMSMCEYYLAEVNGKEWVVTNNKEEKTVKIREITDPVLMNTPNTIRTYSLRGTILAMFEDAIRRYDEQETEYQELLKKLINGRNNE